MRDDALGMFWKDLPAVKGVRGPRERGPMPEIPETGWKPVTSFPNLSAAKVIGFDTETFDPDLRTAGPGWARNKGHIIGASLSVEDGSKWYFPIRHGIEGDKQVLPDHEAAMNMDPTQVLGFLNHVLSDNRPKVGANVIYDVGWLAWEGVKVGGRIYDVQFAEALLNSEVPKVALEDLAQTHLGKGKTTEFLYEWLSLWCGGMMNERQRANLYLSPPSLDGPYAEDDAALPIQILTKQWPLMAERGVLDLFDLECRLVPLLVAMRMKGAPVDVQRAHRIKDELNARLEVLRSSIKEVAGQTVNPNASESVKSAFKRNGIPIPTKVDKKTKETKITFDAPSLEATEHPLADLILQHRQLEKVSNTFIQSYVIDKNVNGRLHCSFHPLKGEGFGARSGRFSSSLPNLQNIPIRTDEGLLVRKAFAVDACGRWRSYDYKSIEYRLLVHFAVGPGANEVRQKFNDFPDTDYHKFVQEMVKDMTAVLLSRGHTKNLNFGLIYGMALNALAKLLGVSKAKAKTLLDAYLEAIPYAKPTMDMCAEEVNNTGVVRTILNRASDFTAWGQRGWNEGSFLTLPYDAAVAKWGMFNIERKGLHKALNRKLQGSAADVMKKAMVEAYEAGLFAVDACGIPILTVHDELDFEDLGDLDNPAWKELTHLMETCMDTLLSIPLRVDVGIGQTWAEAH